MSGRKYLSHSFEKLPLSRNFYNVAVPPPGHDGIRFRHGTDVHRLTVYRGNTGTPLAYRDDPTSVEPINPAPRGMGTVSRHFTAVKWRSTLGTDDRINIVSRIPLNRSWFSWF